MTQARVFETYHVDNRMCSTTRWTSGRSQRTSRSSDNGPMSAYYVIMRLPGAEKEKILLILPFTPNTRPTSSDVGAQSDGAAYGEWWSTSSARARRCTARAGRGGDQQDPAISAQRSLSTSSLARDPRQPHHRADRGHAALRAAGVPGRRRMHGSCKSVIVSTGGPKQSGAAAGLGGDAEQVVVMARDWLKRLADACRHGATDRAARHGGTGGGTGTDGGRNRDGDRRRRRRPRRPRPRADPAGRLQFEAAQAAQQAGDWAEYGRQVEALQETLRQLQDLQSASPALSHVPHVASFGARSVALRVPHCVRQSLDGCSMDGRLPAFRL